MTCKACGKQNNEDNNFCGQCGQTLMTNHADTFLMDDSIQNDSQISNGYFYIALQSFLNAILWFLFDLNKLHGYLENKNVYLWTNIISTLIFVGQLLVMILYTKRRDYKILVMIMAFLITLYNIYYLIDKFYGQYL
jgi:uncharacterized membrane protein YvbJ